MENNKKEIGVYIHIPFCKKKCFYCDFTSFSGCDNLQEKYLNSLKKEIRNTLNKLYKKYNITSIYIGGGTPSYIDSKYIKDIMKTISEYIYINKKITKFDYNTIETTIEVNPGTVTEEKLQSYKNSGINRLSIGLQSTNNKILKEIGRIHNYNQFIETYMLAKKVGFKNINIDLMIGLPNQRIEDIKHSIKKIIEIKPQHISVYSLILEEGTKLYNMVENGKTKLPDENTERKMYWYIKRTLKLAGYDHYEISNFAKKEYESKHNVNCWKQKEYIGIGLNASSYLNGIRYSNTADINEYIKNIETENYEKNKIIEEIQDDVAKQKEFMILGLRMIDGVRIREFEKKFRKNPKKLYKETIEKLIKKELISIDNEAIKLTNKGIDLANMVWQEFI